MFLLLSILFGVLIFYDFVYKRRQYPPGPLPYPLVGNLIELKRLNYYDAILKWKREYGPIFTFWMGEVPVVCFSDYDTIQETLVKEADVFGARFTYGRMSTLIREATEVGMVDVSDRDIYQDQRKFLLRTFREFGVGKNIMQEKILLECSHLHNDIKKEQEEMGSVEVIYRMDDMVGSIICGILFGRRYGEDPLDYQFKEVLTSHMQLFIHPLSLIYSFCPFEFIANLWPMSWARDKAYKNGMFLMNFHRKEIEKHEKKFKEGLLPSEPEDLVDAFLCEMYKSKIHEELDKVIASDRLIQMVDKPNLPYVNAVILEGLRHGNVLALNLMHKNDREITVRGHTIPQGSCVQPLICAVMYDETLFPNPKTFDPTRFIDKNGALTCDQHVLAFSAGARQCIGKNLAMTELFLVMANLLNQFTIECVNSSNPPSTFKNVGVTSSPTPFKAIFKSRFT
ncbi:unnamed protein product [Bursaphelenchus okinawaensis]|uniref:Cytochrome P450 n=1 Tax=Bursaphelenchus okinawaensis TaxID=465554 RepID=A0A811KY06_9BILA|nr:unnamed protein product [Bursaphelenchus okinawaensis]CAG9113536.1 unnamed protein product [Bursaphelenchus okinawaensis]